MVRDLLLDFRPFFLLASRLMSGSIVTAIVWFSFSFLVITTIFHHYVFTLILTGNYNFSSVEQIADKGILWLKMKLAGKGKQSMMAYPVRLVNEVSENSESYSRFHSRSFLLVGWN